MREIKLGDIVYFRMNEKRDIQSRLIELIETLEAAYTDQINLIKECSDYREALQDITSAIDKYEEAVLVSRWLTDKNIKAKEALIKWKTKR